jgi:hypothetical protein
VAAGLDADEHVRRIVRIHFHASTGAPYWLEKQSKLGLDAIAAIRTAADLHKLGPMDEPALRDRPILDFVPLSQRSRLVGAVITETGGTTGPPKRVAFARHEFDQGFVEPFVRVATSCGFPRGGAWLWLGPSGPHIIGQAAAACAAALGSPQPFCVDFDPRWFRKMPADSMGRARYMEHLLGQALHVIDREPIDVVFTTPVLLQQLAARMTPSQRDRVRGVHYGGMRIEPELLRAAQTEWFPYAVHLAGYGNSLFGLCMEVGGPPDRTLRYFPRGPRHQVRVAADGRVWMSRLDETVLIANLRERDVGTAVRPPATWSADYGAGVEDPRSAEPGGTVGAAGIY